MFDTRNKLSTLVEKDVRHHLKEKVYKSVIPRNVRISEAPSHGLPVYYMIQNAMDLKHMQHYQQK